MAKTFSLTPKADASLISAATKASLASAPGDYSTIFQNVSTVYSNTMQAQADAFSQVAQLGGKLAKEVVQNAQETNSIIAQAGLYGDYEGINSLVDEIEQNKEEQKKLSVFKIGFGNKEQRRERLRLKMEQQELFADVEKIGATIANGAKFIEEGNYDTNISSVHYNELVNAILKLNHKNKVTENKNRAVFRTNENGVREFALVNNETGEVVKKQDGSDFTMTLSQFTNHLSENAVDKENLTGKNFNSLDQRFLQLGKESNSSVMSSNMEGLYLNNVDEIINTKGALARAMNVKHGFDNKSFKEALMGESVISAKIFNILLRHYDPTDTDGKINIVGENFLSTLDKNKDGLTQEELNVGYAGFANYIVTMQDEELTRKIFKFNALEKGKSVFAEGYSQRATDTSTKTDDYGGYSYSAGETGGHPLSNIPGIQTGVAFDTKMRNRRMLLARTSFPGLHFYYDITQNEDNTFTANALHKEGGDIIIENISGSKIAQIEGLLSSNDESLSIFNFATSERTEIEQEENTPPPGTRGLTLSNLKNVSPRGFKDLITSKFSKNVLDDYDFRYVSTPSAFAKAPLLDKNKIIIKSKDGKYNKTFTIGNNATMETVREINLLFQDDYLKPVNRDFETEQQ